MTGKRFAVRVDGIEYEAQINGIANDGIEVLLNGHPYHVSFAEIAELKKETRSSPAALKLPNPVPPQVEINLEQVTSPLPGEIIEVMIAPGNEVEVGQGLIVLESMKMKNIIYSSRAGVIKQVFVSQGQSVAYGDLLVEFE